MGNECGSSESGYHCSDFDYLDGIDLYEEDEIPPWMGVCCYCEQVNPGLAKYLKGKSMKSAMVYVAAPYTHESRTVMNRRANQVARACPDLIELYDVYTFSPITYSRGVEVTNPDVPTDFEYWEGFDLFMISLCAELWVYRMDGWAHSKGVSREVRWALDNGIPVRYIDSETLEVTNDRTSAEITRRYLNLPDVPATC